MNTVIFIAAAVILAVLTGVLASLLRAEHREKISETNKKVVLHGGKNVNPDAVANGDGIIGEDMSLEHTVVRRRGGKSRTELLCLTDQESGQVYRGRFFDQQILVGRREGHAEHGNGRIYVEDSKVSHVHCRIYRGKDGYMIEDCHSTNHTWVNGIQVTACAPLKDGDRLRLAKKTYEVQFLLEYT